MAKVKIASYNIHGWVDADHDSNLERVVEVVNKHDPDILCLQEVYACWELPCLLEFMRKTFFEHTLRWEGCAILSKKKFVITEFGQGSNGLEDAGGRYHRLLPKAPGFEFNRPRYLTAEVKTENHETLFYITCIHLVPKYSELRYEEIVRISEDLTPLFHADKPQLWLGDFNTLSRADYSDEEWEEIVRIRRDNGRKAPLNDVIDGIEKLGFSDNWTKAGRPSPRTTSRFETRVDYVFSSHSFDKNWTLQSFHHFPSDASDHSFVVTEFGQTL